MATRVPLIIHERIAAWSAQIRPRVTGWSVRVVETRSTADLLAAVRGIACPIIVADLAVQPIRILRAIHEALCLAPDSLVLLIDPQGSPAITEIALEVGATLVVIGSVSPPRVLVILRRWLPIALRRAESSGWSDEPMPAREPWEVLLDEAAHSLVLQAKTKRLAGERSGVGTEEHAGP